MYKPVALRPGSWGVDTSAPVSPALLAELRKVDLHTYCPAAPPGTRPEFIVRCAPLPRNNSGRCLGAKELTNAMDEGFVVLVYQHVRAGSWVCSGQQGDEDAQVLTAYAKSIGYMPAQVDGLLPHLIKDMESLANPGPQAVAGMQRFRDRVAGEALWRPAGYEGFDSGLTTQQWADQGVAVWSDYGPRTPPPGRGFAMKQHPQVEILGMYFDIDQAMTDLTGENFVGMGKSVDPEAPTEPPPPEA